MEEAVAIAPVGARVHVLTITHRHGDNVSVHQTGAGARAALGAYVKEWWEDEMHQTPMPTEINEAIDWYFEAVETEFFFIEFVEVQP